MSAHNMPGESLWIPLADVLSKRNLMPGVSGCEVRVRRGPHAGKSGIVRTVDGASEMVQIRTGDPAEWEKWDAETRRMIEERQA